ncbi:MAG: hypothetical protein DRN14_04600 [Thermoplasmata archaeon]|nr:MAG: hypothetical protein DRN14_04600 [Thermoplasmata archaeon]
MIDVKEIINELKVKLGPAVSEDVLKAEVVREVIYKESDLLAVGTKLVAVRKFGALDVKWAYPGEMNAEYPVPEGATAEIAEPIEWTEFNLTLKKAVVRFAITDEAKLRQLGNYQLQFSRRRASEALAKKKDEEILTALSNGAGNTVAADATWDSDTADPAGDIIEAISKIFQNSNILEAEIQKIAVVVPAKVWAPLHKLQEINNLKQSIKDYLEGSYGLKFYPSRLLDTYAMVLVPGEMTAIHGVLDTRKIPLVEEIRRPEMGATEYVIKQYFATKVVPDTSDGKSYRICKITGVSS